ncbi:MAG TPA: class I SAM-dependent methyltransferase [Actinomycetota bacterium]|nr:class I SAM-dependent methyltransferase [Actinomycetota bacterium]
MWRRLSYALAYRTGRTPWDTGVTPPEVVELIEGTDGLAPGRALDLGCGTGTNVAYLARHGWHGTGVEANDMAFKAADWRLRNIDDTRVFRGDVTRLHELPLDARFDLALDIGCFHSIAPARRDEYARGVARHTTAGATLFVFAFARRPGLIPIGVTPREMHDRFAPWFEPVGRIAGTQPPGAAWYRLRRLA